MTNMQRVIAVRALYNSALYVIGTSVASYGAPAPLREAVVSSDAMDLLNSHFKRIPSMFGRFIDFLSKEQANDALDQVNFMILSLESVLSRISGYMKIIGPHNNDAAFSENDLLSLSRLEKLAKDQLYELQKEKSALGG